VKLGKLDSSSENDDAPILTINDAVGASARGRTLEVADRTASYCRVIRYCRVIYLSFCISSTLSLILEEGSSETV
jgi:hypothetical protein